MHWQCGCPEPRIHPATTESCESCGYLRPPSIVPLTADERARFAGIVDWLDERAAASPGIIGSPVGTGVAYLLSAARGDPDGTWYRLATVRIALESMARWIAEGVEPAESDLTALFGA